RGVRGRRAGRAAQSRGGPGAAAPAVDDRLAPRRRGLRVRPDRGVRPQRAHDLPPPEDPPQRRTHRRRTARHLGLLLDRPRTGRQARRAVQPDVRAHVHRVTREIDVLVIGGGQAGLAAGYYLRRAGADFVILDAQERPGGAWQHAWTSLRLFSPAQYSSLPGRMMPVPPDGGYPSAADTVAYLTDYERRYELPVLRPVTANAVRRGDGHLVVETDRGVWQAKTVISATGTWWRPYVPHYAGVRDFGGEQLHTVDYRDPEPFRGRHVVIVGGGNSAAQLLADISTVTTTTW